MGKYKSEKTCTLGYFTQCWFSVFRVTIELHLLDKYIWYVFLIKLPSSLLGVTGVRWGRRLIHVLLDENCKMYLKKMYYLAEKTN